MTVIAILIGVFEKIEVVIEAIVKKVKELFS